ncbi:metal-dependent hydrolase [Natrinema hispanicum]|uniref:LexA-binding, inner membrane-associated putative hydrolase n=1 Tax=Natrinema hispanicum TaxID=392421 RepID=A0A1I0IL20_9EURY|nr:metal-dependent hydrolase [Natrinema hispanicum]SDD39930.1 LexA-binding, inner membrane-associated putative hydrolase [Natrinema hispanicum]SET96986.1 LexA-binding, inner membrane-associated putative hydrolase [Natrinema hispanicum]
MWPWEHALFGYLVYSAVCHAHYRDAPGEYEAAVVLIASVLPDVVDKTLAWQFDVFHSGYALAHSIFITVPLVTIAGLVAREYGRPALGLAFAIGYPLHLVGDVIPSYISSGEWTISHLLWPVVIIEGRDHGGLLEGFRHNFGPYLAEVLALEPTPYLLVQVGIALTAVGLWIVDGWPGCRLVVRWNRLLYERLS